MNLKKDYSSYGQEIEINIQIGTEAARHGNKFKKGQKGQRGQVDDRQLMTHTGEGYKMIDVYELKIKRLNYFSIDVYCQSNHIKQ